MENDTTSIQSGTINLFAIYVVEWLSKKIIHFLIKAPNLVQHLLNYSPIEITIHIKLKKPEIYIYVLGEP